MALVNEVIKFRSLVGSLNDQEFIVFLSNIIQQYGRDVFLSSFCNQFLQTQCINTNIPTSTINTATNIVRNIITSRHSSHKSAYTHSSTTRKLDSLPSSLIGEIASYLKHKSYSLLSQSNRAIYIGCNNPNTLRELNLFNVDNYSCIKLSKYRQIKYLKLNLRKFSELSLPSNTTILPQLTQLSLMELAKPKLIYLRLHHKLQLI